MRYVLALVVFVVGVLGGGVAPAWASGGVQGCQNQHKTCKACPDASCTDTIEVPVGEPCPPGHQWPGSLIVNINMTWIGTGADYTSASGSPTCSSCSGSLPSVGALPSLNVRRYHRYRDLAQQGSLGPGGFLNYDITLTLDASPASTSIMLYDPAAMSATTFRVGHPASGVYTDTTDGGMKDVRTYDAGGQIVVDQALAVRVVLTAWNGMTYTWEVIRTSSDPGTLTRYGRLIEVRDRNGNTTQVTYQYPFDADDVTLASDRSNLWKMSTAIDAHGRQASFTYGAVPVGGRWAVSQIDLPLGRTVQYLYDEPADTNDMIGLKKVILADGSEATLSVTSDAATQTQVLHYFDPTEKDAHRRKDVRLTNWTWVDPVTQEITEQSGNLVREVINGAGELRYANDTAFDAATGVSVGYIYKGGNSLTRLATQFWGAPKKLEQAQAWAPGQDVTMLPYDLVEEYQTSGWAQRRTTGKTDILGRTKSFDVDLASGSIKKTTFEDLSVESRTYNQFQEPLQHIDRLGRKTLSIYDANGNLLTKTVAAGTPVQASKSWTYNLRGQPVTETDANGNVTTYAYTPEGYLASVTEPSDLPGGPHAVTSYTYDGAGRLSSITDPRGRVTSFAYDARNRTTGVTYNDGTVESFVYGTGADANLKVQVTDRLGVVEKIAYDLAGRELHRIKAFGRPEAVSRACTYLSGTELPLVCTDRGETTSYTYDNYNRLVGITVHPNTATALTDATVYDSVRRVDQRIDRYGRKTFFVYDVNDRTARTVHEMVPGAITLPLPPGAPGYLVARDAYLNGFPRVLTPNAPYLIEEMQYDAEGQVLTRIDGRGVSMTMVYDAQGREITRTEAAGTPAQAVTHFQYDPESNRTAVINPRGFTTQYTYTGRNLVASMTGAVGTPEAATESYTYDLDRKRNQRIDGRGNAWGTRWSQCCGYHQAEVDPPADVDGDANTPDARAIRAVGRDSLGHVTHEFIAADASAFGADASFDDPAVTLNEVTTRYDGLYRPIAQTVWMVELGAVDENHPPIAGDPGYPPVNGLTTKMAYDDDLTDGVGLDAIYAVHLAGLNLGAGSDGMAVEVTNPAGERSVTAYDGLGRVIKAIDGNGNTTRQMYDAMVAGTPGAPGSLVELVQIDGLGHVKAARLDGAGRALAMVDELGFVTRSGYDAAGNRAHLRDPNDLGEDCVFDERGRETQRMDTHGDATQKAYDAIGNVVATADGLGQITSFLFDGRDRKIAVADRLGGVTNFVYDEIGNLLSIRDADANQRGEIQPTTVHTYDTRNLLLSEGFRGAIPTEVLGADDTKAYAYDAARRLLARLDQAGDLVGYVRDRANRLIQRTYPDGLNDTFAYDGAGRLLTATSARYANTVTREYSAGGEHAGRLKSEILTMNGQSYVTQYGYDADNRKTDLIYPNGDVVNRAYTARDELESVSHAGATVAVLTYDAGGRRTTTTFGNGLVETRAYQSDNQVLAIQTPGVTDFSYVWDASKRKLAELDGVSPENGRSFGYDAEDRLTSSNRMSGQTQAWGLSLVGDWTTFNDNGTLETRVHDAVHQLTSIGAAPFGYDPKGNLTQNGSGQIYTWDFDNQMNSAKVGAAMTEYAYDALGRRVSRGGAAPVMFVSDGWQEIAEHPVGGAPAAPLRVYVFGSYVDEPLLMVQSLGVSRTYYHTNQVYSIAALTDQAGSVVERYTYDPYGKMTILEPGGVNSILASAVDNPWGFTGRRVDPETGSLYYRTRMYGASLGRFFNRNPWGYAHRAIQLYDYVSDQPTSWLEPFSKEEPKGPNTPPPKPQPGTATPLDMTKPYTDPANKDVYNCHSSAWHRCQGDPCDPGNAGLPPKWDNDPSDQMAKAKKLTPGVDDAKVGDVVVYGTDRNGNGKFDPGEIDHSAKVTDVNAKGEIGRVESKEGQGPTTDHHPSDQNPGYGNFKEYYRPQSTSPPTTAGPGSTAPSTTPGSGSGTPTP